MLQNIRNYAGSVVVRILFAVLILSFFVWGIADVFRPGGGGSDWAAKVGDRKISKAAFESDYQASARRLQQQLGGNFDPEAMRQLGLGRNVINQIVNRTLIEEEAAALKLNAPDDLVRKAIAEDRRFRNSQGQFDPQVLQAFIRQLGRTEQGFFNELRNELDISRVVDGVLAGVVLPLPMREAIRDYLTEKRSIEYVKVAFDQQKVNEPDEAALADFYEKHIDRYMTPELRAVTALVIDPATVADLVQIDDAQVRTAYDERVDEFTTPERRTFAQLLFDNEAAASEAATRLKAGAAMEDVATSAGLDAGAVIRIGPVAESQLPAPLQEPVFSAGKGALAGPVETGLGWHVIDITAIEPATAEPFAEVAPRLKEELTHEKAGELVIDIGNRIEDGLGRGQPLEEIASANSLTVRQFPAMTRDGNDGSGKPWPDLPPNLATTAFATAKGGTSELVEASRDQYFVVRVDEIVPAQRRDFAEVRKAVAEAWRADKQREEGTALAAKVTERASAGGGLADAGRDFALSAAHAGPFDRQEASTDASLPPEVVRRALDEAAGKLISVPTENAVFVLRTTVVPTAPVTEVPPTVEREYQQAETALRNDILSQYLTALRSRYPVTVNEAVVVGSPQGN